MALRHIQELTYDNIWNGIMNCAGSILLCDSCWIHATINLQKYVDVDGDDLDNNNDGDDTEDVDDDE